MEFFGFCEGAFNCLLAPGVNALTVKCLRKRIRLFQIILPNMARVYPEFCVNVLRECKQQKLV